MLVRYKQNSAGKQVKQALVYTKEEHKILLRKIDREAIKVIQRLHTNGYEAYLVGGAVRDLLIGKTPKDFDIATSADPYKIRKLFRNSRIIGRRFRLVHVFFGEKIYEVSTFRSIEDGSVGNKFGTIEEDVHRRDFTLNALYYDPIHELVIDYVDGVKDIKERKIKPIIALPVIFVEDPVRMIRAVKYAAMTKSKIPFFVKLQIKKNAHRLETVSPSRLTEEINKIIFSCHSQEIIKMLIEYKLYPYIQPAACIFMEESSTFKKNYLQDLKELDEKICKKKRTQQGECLIPLLREYIKKITPADGSIQEIYSFVYRECRHFILPMNPQRKELEFAVKTCLQEIGVKITAERTSPRPQKFSQQQKRKPRRKKRSSSNQ